MGTRLGFSLLIFVCSDTLKKMSPLQVCVLDIGYMFTYFSWEHISFTYNTVMNLVEANYNIDMWHLYLSLGHCEWGPNNFCHKYKKLV